MSSLPLEKRAVESILSNELDLQKGTDEIIKIKLDDSELFRVFYENETNVWILTHALPKTRRYFRDFDSADKQAIIDIVNQYPIRSISLRNDHPIYSKNRLISRIKNLSTRFGKRKNIKRSEQKYLISFL